MFRYGVRSTVYGSPAVITNVFVEIEGEAVAAEVIVPDAATELEGDETTIKVAITWYWSPVTPDVAVRITTCTVPTKSAGGSTVTYCSEVWAVVIHVAFEEAI